MRKQLADVAHLFLRSWVIFAAIFVEQTVSREFAEYRVGKVEAKFAEEICIAGGD